jgi:hypothetical protein
MGAGASVDGGSSSMPWAAVAEVPESYQSLGARIEDAHLRAIPSSSWRSWESSSRSTCGQRWQSDSRLHHHRARRRRGAHVQRSLYQAAGHEGDHQHVPLHTVLCQTVNNKGKRVFFCGAGCIWCAAASVVRVALVGRGTSFFDTLPSAG